MVVATLSRSCNHMIERGHLTWREMPSGFRPSRYLADEKDFGRRSEPEWNAALPHESAQLALAQLQHSLAVQLRADLGDEVADRLAEQTGQESHYLVRKLNGQVPITALDLMTWAETAGIDLPSRIPVRRDVPPPAASHQ